MDRPNLVRPPHRAAALGAVGSGCAGFCWGLRAMGLSGAQRQARWRARRDALVRANPEALERSLVEDAERCERMSDQERTVLADQLTDIALRQLLRAGDA